MPSTTTAETPKSRLGKKQKRRKEAILFAADVLGGPSTMFTRKVVERSVDDVFDLAEYVLHGDVTVRVKTDLGLGIMNLNRGIPVEAVMTDVVPVPSEEDVPE
jgi:hypothetical protein